MTSIKEVTISSGGFTAEHGNIRSGLVNVITKEGSRNNYIDEIISPIVGRTPC